MTTQKMIYACGLATLPFWPMNAIAAEDGPQLAALTDATLRAEADASARAAYRAWGLDGPAEYAAPWLGSTAGSWGPEQDGTGDYDDPAGYPAAFYYLGDFGPAAERERAVLASAGLDAKSLGTAPSPGPDEHRADAEWRAVTLERRAAGRERRSFKKHLDLLSFDVNGRPLVLALKPKRDALYLRLRYRF